MQSKCLCEHGLKPFVVPPGAVGSLINFSQRHLGLMATSLKMKKKNHKPYNKHLVKNNKTKKDNSPNGRGCWAGLL